MEALKVQYYTYADYVTWDDGKRYELIDGVPYMMSGPSAVHAIIVSELNTQFSIFLKGKQCSVFTAPFDVRLDAVADGDAETCANCGETADKNTRDYSTVVQPDILVYCDRSKIDMKGGKGAPDLIVEILSPGSTKMDKYRKFIKYRQAGVPEYWIVDPLNYSIQVNLLENGAYKSHEYFDGDIISVATLPGLDIDTFDLFGAVEELFALSPDRSRKPGKSPVLPQD